MINSISKSQLNKIGRELRKSKRTDSSPDSTNLQKLQDYRVSHQQALSVTFDTLVKRSKRHHKGCVVAYRLKRIDTIQRKLIRYPSMALAKMQDIAGCRTIVSSATQIFKIVDDFKADPNFEIIKTDDYITDVRPSGYSSVHLIVKPITSTRFVEIQLRTIIQHHWATLVEITDLLFQIKLKEGQDHPELFTFHRLLSRKMDKLNSNEIAKIVSIEMKYSLIEKMTTIFRTNYYLSLKRWIKNAPLQGLEYVIIELDQDFSPLFRFFDSFLQAENFYFKKFSQYEPNMVLVNLDKPDFEKLGLAYSNYVLTSHPSIRIYLEILQKHIIYIAKKGISERLREYRLYYEKLVNGILESFSAELDFMDEILRRSKKPNESSHEMIESWRNNLEDRIAYIAESNAKFAEEIDILTQNDSVFSKISNSVGRFFGWNKKY